MPTTRETILTALHTRLSALPATALRGEVLPERVPAAGLLILRDGEPGDLAAYEAVVLRAVKVTTMRSSLSIGIARPLQPVSPCRARIEQA